MVTDRAQFRWINHTYSHEYLGCQQNFTVTLNLPLTLNSNNASQFVADAATTIRAILSNKGYNAD